jgi:hypothetical protein
VCGHDAFDAGRLCGALEDQDAGSVVVSADADVVRALVDVPAWSTRSVGTRSWVSVRVPGFASGRAG